MTNSTRWAPFAAALLAVALQAQDAGQQALARAQLLEQQEGDLAAAQAAYRALLADERAKAQHGEAALRLGALLWRLDKKDDGKPFLERAVAAGGDVAARATAVLQGQDDAGKQAQERLEKARALAERIDELVWYPAENTSNAQTVQSLCDQVRWLGDAAAIAIAERMADLVNVDEGALRTDKGNPIPNWATFSKLLWEIGGPRATEFLLRIADGPKVSARRFVTAAAKQAKVAADLEPVLVRFARDPDPTGEVWQNIEPSIQDLPVARLLVLANEAQPGVQAAALAGIARNWPVPDTDAWLRDNETMLKAAMHSSDARVSRAAWKLANRFLRIPNGPRRGTEILLRELPTAPDELVDSDNFAMRVEGNDAWLHLLAETGRKLGAVGARTNRQWIVSSLLNTHSAVWTSAAVDDALALLELDYAWLGAPGDDWLVRAAQLASPEQLSRLIRLLPHAPLSEKTLQQLASMTLPAEVFPALRDVTTALLDGSITAWQTTAVFETRSHGDGRVYRYQKWSPLLSWLLNAVTRTRAAAAADWLTEQALQRPPLAYGLAESLCDLSKANVAEAKKGMRTLLVWPGVADFELPRPTRTRLFGELARVGDVDAIPLFPRAYELGLDRTTLQSDRGSINTAGIGALAIPRPTSNVRPQAWHGYGKADLVRAWRTLLDSPAAEDVWTELGSVITAESQPNGRVSPMPRAFDIPIAVLSLLCERLPARWAKTTYADRNELQSALNSTFRVSREDLANDAELAAALRTLFTKADPELAVMVFSCLWPDTAAVFADEARQLLQRAPQTGWITYVARAGIDLPVEDWRALLARTEPYYGLIEVLKVVPPSQATNLRHEVEAMLQHAKPEVRIAGAQAMQRLYASDAVASLLPLLQDPSDEVRKAARASLDQLREEYERRTFWADAKSGVDVSPAGAAAKLVAQAKAGEAKEQRLLAIRSLAVLGAAESLPYLIDWTKDADAEVAAAAREAIVRVHAKAGPAAPK